MFWGRICRDFFQEGKLTGGLQSNCLVVLFGGKMLGCSVLHRDYSRGGTILPNNEGLLV